MTEATKYRLETKMSFCGFQLIANDCMVSDLVRARRHKKKRIDKKWLKRYGYKRFPMRTLCIVDGKIYGHSKYIEKILREARKNNGVVNDVWFC